MSGLSRSQFVGHDRVALVDELVAAFDEVAADGGVRMHVLSGPSGVGKTRVVQEVYARLAETQPEPRYWPTQLTDQSDWKLSRKLIYPTEVEVPPDAQIPWLWWGLSCQRRQSGVLHQALFEDLAQVLAHSPSIDSRQSSGSSAQRAFDVSDAAVNIAALAGVSTAAFLAGPLAIGGISMTAWWGTRKLTEKVRSRQEHRAKSREGFVVDAGLQRREDELAEIAGWVAKLSSRVPFVMVIDDIHWADTTLVAFLEHLARNKASRVLVIATQWPQSDTRTPWQEFVDAAHCATHNLGALDDAAVRKLIKSEYRRVAAADVPFDEAIADLVVERVGASPMAIRALFGIERTRRMIEQGSLTAAETNWIPRDLKSLLSLYWEELPRGVRDVLVIAALAGNVFPNSPVLEAAEATGVENAADLLGRSHQPFGYVKPVSEIIHWFTDPIFHKVAFEEANELLTPSEVAQVHEALSSFAQGIDPDDPAAEIAWRIHVELADQGNVDKSVAVSSAIQLARCSLARFDFNTTFAMLDRAENWSLGLNDEENLLAQFIRAHALAESGSHQEALNRGRRLLPTLLEVVGDDHPDALSFRNDLARWRGAAGRVDEAINEFEQLLKDRCRVLDDDHPDVLITRHDLAVWRGEAGRVDEAIDDFERLLADVRRVQGDDYPGTLTIRHNLARLFSEAGRVDEAIAELAQLLEDRRRVRGEDHPDTLATWHNLTNQRARVGRVDEAINEFERLLTAIRRVHGDDHPSTFATRHNLAHLFSRAGRIDEGIAELEQLLEDRCRVQGEDHPDVFAARNGLASLRAEAGRADEAIAEFEQLLADASRVLGDDHPSTLTVRGNLVHWRRHAGRTDEAIAEYEQLLEDRRRVQGDDHPDVLITRHNLAIAQADVGRVDEAIAEFEQLLADASRVLGDDHPETLSVRHHLATMQANVGRIDEAIEGHEQVLKDQSRVLGDDHPDTMLTSELLLKLQRHKLDREA